MGRLRNRSALEPGRDLVPGIESRVRGPGLGNKVVYLVERRREGMQLSRGVRGLEFLRMNVKLVKHHASFSIQRGINRHPGLL